VGKEDDGSDGDNKVKSNIYLIVVGCIGIVAAACYHGGCGKKQSITKLGLETVTDDTPTFFSTQIGTNDICIATFHNGQKVNMEIDNSNFYIDLKWPSPGIKASISTNQHKQYLQ